MIYLAPDRSHAKYFGFERQDEVETSFLAGRACSGTGDAAACLGHRNIHINVAMQACVVQFDNGTNLLFEL